jgi:dTDP-4-amino-4,6-dideoxygalactose transaminase
VLPPLDRATIMTALAEVGIPSRAYFAPIHLQPFYVTRFGYRRGDFPVAEALGDRCLALPFSATMTEEAVDRVCGALRDIVRSIEKQARREPAARTA